MSNGNIDGQTKLKLVNYMFLMLGQCLGHVMWYLRSCFSTLTFS